MLTRPVPLLVQVCADQFSLRRFGRISQAVIVFALRLLRPSTGRRRGWLVAVLMVISSAA